MRVIFFLLFFTSNLAGMEGKEIRKNLLPYVTLNAQDSVSVLRFTKNNSNARIVVGTKSINNSYIDSLMYIFDTDGKILGTMTNPGEVNCLDTCPEKDECISDCGKSVKIWDLEKMKLKTEFLAAEDAFPIVSLEYNKSGKQMLCAEDTMAKIWDCKSEEFVQTFNGHVGGIGCACWSTDDKHVATVGADGTIKLWDTRSGGLIKTEKRPTKKPTIAFNSNNDLICGDLYLYAYEPGLAFAHAFNFDGKIEPIKGSRLEHNNIMPQARSLAFIPDNPVYIIAGINNGTVCLCNQTDTSQSLKMNAMVASNVGADDTGKALGVSPDGKILAVGSFLEQAVRLWKIEQLISHDTKSIQSEASSNPEKTSPDCCILN